MTLDFIIDEREREMSGEMTRWDDLHRPGKDFFLARIRAWNPYAAPNITDKHYFRPIPQQQIQGVTGPAPYPQNRGGEVARPCRGAACCAPTPLINVRVALLLLLARPAAAQAQV